ncbi:hypothetical protein, partial [Helicobacter valdiviensis]
MEAFNQKNSLNIRLLSSNNILLHNQEFKLYEIAQGNKNEIKTIFTTNRMGEAHLNTSEIFSKEAQSFELILNQSRIYKNKPIYNHRFLLRSYEYGHWCEIKFERKADKGSINSIRLKPKEFTLENNEKIVRNFYTFGDIVEFEAIYEDTKIKEEQIQWGYVFIQDKNTLDKLNKNQLTNNKKESSLFDEEILKDCFYIEKKEDKALLSSSIIYRQSKNNKAYCGKHLSLQLPNLKDTQEQKALLVFAYKEIPNYNASYLIRINDYPQITIDCTLAETLRAHTNKDEISRLGWGVSYICQRLWHDNPSDAKELKDLTFLSSTSQDFLDTIPNETMKTIIKEILPKITLKEYDKNYSKIGEEYYNKYKDMYLEFETYKSSNNISNIKDKTIGLKAIGDIINFYIELDWEEFYMKFPLVKRLEKEISSIQIEEKYTQLKNIPTGKYENKSEILTQNLLNSIQDFINSKSDILHKTFKDTSQTNLHMQVTANLLEIAKNPKGVKIPKSIHKVFDTKKNMITALNIKYEEANDRKFSFIKDAKNLQKHEKTLNEISPSDLRRSHMQFYGISDIDFGIEYKLGSKEKSSQAIAFYALSGKFQIYYVLDSFEAIKMNEKEIAIYPTQIK